MQPNVRIKKSWTTANISSEVEGEKWDGSQEMSVFKSRDLIREYLLKTRVPEILKPQQFRQHSNYDTSIGTSDINLAYKHPLVIAEELKNDAGEQLAVDNSSFIVPSAKKLIKRPKKSLKEERPRLIGKVTPGIAKTWEQITNAMDSSSVESQPEEEDKQSYVLFVRKPFNFQPSEDFSVNKIQHDQSEKFYDSIDQDFQYAESFEDEEAVGVEGGEKMAEGLDSLEMRYNDVILWSIES